MQPLNRRQMAWRAAQDIGSGLLVNLGIGMPVHAADYLRPEVDVFIQAENGVIGAGPLASPEHADPDLVDASSRRITLRPGASIVDSSWSFAMIRGGHIDITILGAFEVAPTATSPTGTCGCPTRGRWSAAPWTWPRAPARCGSSWSTTRARAGPAWSRPARCRSRRCAA